MSIPICIVTVTTHLCMCMSMCACARALFQRVCVYVCVHTAVCARACVRACSRSVPTDRGHVGDGSPYSTLSCLQRKGHAAPRRACAALAAADARSRPPQRRVGLRGPLRAASPLSCGGALGLRLRRGRAAARRRARSPRTRPTRGPGQGRVLVT